LPQWPQWYGLRRFHATVVSEKAESDEAASKALGNSKDVVRAHYIKATAVRGDVRRAVVAATEGLNA
jgi:hypothetical protein